jgi:hypothetical protein
MVKELPSIAEHAPTALKVAQELRIGSALVQAIRMAKAANSASSAGETSDYR